MNLNAMRFGRRSGPRLSLDAAASLMMIVASVAILWSVISGRQPFGSGRTPQPVEPAVPELPVSLSGFRLHVDPRAPLLVIEYSDFQCAYSQRFAVDTWPEVRKRFVETGRVRFAFAHLPLEEIHPAARSAAEIAECAGGQGRFWEMHDWLFAHQRSLNDEVADDGFHRLSASVGLNEADLRICLSTVAGSKVNDNETTARSLGIEGTPTFLLGWIENQESVRVVRRLDGAVPFSKFEAVLEQIMAEGPPK